MATTGKRIPKPSAGIDKEFLINIKDSLEEYIKIYLPNEYANLNKFQQNDYTTTSGTRDWHLPVNCTDIYAINYNQAAEDDDGSCCYDNACLEEQGLPGIYGVNLYGDLPLLTTGERDGLVNVLDIVRLVSYILSEDFPEYYIPPYHECVECPDIDMETIQNIYEPPAIYIQGNSSINFIGFLIPENTTDQPLVCSGTYGDMPEADEFCATATNGDECGEFDVFGNGTLIIYLGRCREYEVHRILSNSIYNVLENPDLGEYSPDTTIFTEDDRLYTDFYQIGEDEIDTLDDIRVTGLATYLPEISSGEMRWKAEDASKSFFRRGRGYYLKTQNSGWLKVTSERPVLSDIGGNS